jgi:hypothetical protein
MGAEVKKIPLDLKKFLGERIKKGEEKKNHKFFTPEPLYIYKNLL